MLLENNCNNLFEEVNKLNYSWINDLRKYINTRIEFYTSALKSEAELDNNEYLANYDFLYTSFKRNEELEEHYAQYEVLKYLRVHMIIKCLKYVVGEWTFTDTDKEMLDKLVELQNQERCMPKKLKFNSVSTPIEHVFDDDMRDAFMLQYYDPDYAERIVPVDERFVELPYLITFQEWIAMLLQITTGKGMFWNKEHSWDNQSKLTDLTQFFKFEFDVVWSSTSKSVLVNEEHTNCKQYEQDKLEEQKHKTKKAFMFNLGCAVASLCTENDKTPFGIRNKLVSYVSSKCFNSMKK